MHIVASEDATTKIVERHDDTVLVRNYLGTVMELGVGPQAFLAEMDAGARVGSHFHDVDQFQLFVRGRGRIGKDEWAPGSFHYADAFTPYGPITPEPGSELAFFTLRHATSSGYYGMPESRDRIPGKRGRNQVAHFQFAESQSGLDGTVQELLSLPEDGIRGDGMHLGPGSPLDDEPALGAGQYLVVLAGSLMHAGRTLSPLSVIFADADEPVAGFTAGPEGAKVIRLRFPRATERPGSDPKKLARRTLGEHYEVAETKR